MHGAWDGATSQRVTGSIPGHWGFFPEHQTVPWFLESTEYQDIPEGKDDRCVRVTTLQPSCAECLEILES
jgi:hypothetical protein